MKKNVLLLIIILLLLGSQTCLAEEVSKLPTIEVQFKETGNMQYSIFNTTINAANNTNFKSVLVYCLLQENYNITYSNDYQIVALKPSGYWASKLVGDYRFLFNFAQSGNTIQFSGKGEVGFRPILFQLMLKVLNNYTGHPVHGQTYE